MTTNRYASPSALRAALDRRLLDDARQAGRDPNWLRRRLVFARLLTRLVDDTPKGWILKGGMAVELRRPGLARSTRDIDLVLQEGVVADPTDADGIRDLLIEALARDVDRDGFIFRVGTATKLADGTALR